MSLMIDVDGMRESRKAFDEAASRMVQQRHDCRAERRPVREWAGQEYIVMDEIGLSENLQSISVIPLEPGDALFHGVRPHKDEPRQALVLAYQRDERCVLVLTEAGELRLSTTSELAIRTIAPAQGDLDSFHAERDERRAEAARKEMDEHDFCYVEEAGMVENEEYGWLGYLAWDGKQYGNVWWPGPNMDPEPDPYKYWDFECFESGVRGWFDEWIDAHPEGPELGGQVRPSC
jgi:hypothetical protein